MHIRICACMYMYVYVYVCIYIFKNKKITQKKQTSKRFEDASAKTYKWQIGLWKGLKIISPNAY